MATTPTSPHCPDAARAFPTGQHLRCATCGSEIQIITPTPVEPSQQVFRCCGAAMEPVGPAEPPASP
jgi:hypothetical protein